MTQQVASLTLDQVNEGDALPEFKHDVTATTVILGAIASRDTRPMHHDRDFAQIRNGTRDIFLNTPNQAAWFERYLTDWSGAKGRLGKIQFKMKASVYPGDTMCFTGKVASVETDEQGCGWANLAVNLSVGDTTVTDCSVRMALPLDAEDNPWKRRGEHWKP